MIKFFTLLLIAYCLLMGFAYFFSDLFTFYPPKSSYKDTANIIKIKTKTDQLISTIYLPNNKAKYVLLVNHGNAEDLGHISQQLQQFHDLGLAVFAYDYSGYGTSTGNASEKNAYADANAAYQYLIDKLHFKPEQIIVYGRSVGAALAIDIASHHTIAGLIIQSPFVTAFRTITQLPILPFDKFNNLKKIKAIHCPILIIHGTADKTIPFWQGKKLFNEANPPKQYLWIHGGSHNNLTKIAGENYWGTIKKFLSVIPENM